MFGWQQFIRISTVVKLETFQIRGDSPQMSPGEGACPTFFHELLHHVFFDEVLFLEQLKCVDFAGFAGFDFFDDAEGALAQEAHFVEASLGELTVFAFFELLVHFQDSLVLV